MAAEDDLNGMIVASMRYVVDIDGTIYLDFYWDSESESNPEANETFSELFYKINSGELLSESIAFIGKTLKEDGQSEEFERFYQNSVELQRLYALPILASLGIFPEKDDSEVVVKPTDIAQLLFKGNET